MEPYEARQARIAELEAERTALAEQSHSLYEEEATLYYPAVEELPIAWDLPAIEERRAFIKAERGRIWQEMFALANRIEVESFITVGELKWLLREAPEDALVCLEGEASVGYCSGLELKAGEVLLHL